MPKTEVPSTPTNPGELAEILADDKACKALFNATPEERQDFFTAYNAIVNQGDNISSQVTEQVSAVMMEWLKENGVTDRPDMSELADEITARFSPQAPPPPANPKIYNPRALGASLDDMNLTGGEFFSMIWEQGGYQIDDKEAKLTRLRNAFSEKVPKEGGFLVPETLRANLLKISLETSVVRSRARVVPMESLRVPFPMIDSTSNVSSVYGGIVAYWTEESGTLTESAPSWGRLVLEAKKLTLYAQVPSELASDSISSFAVFFDELFPEAIAFEEDDKFINGTGAGEPLGFLNGDAVISQTKESGQSADTIVWENLVKMYSRMLPSSVGRAVWVVSHDTFAELATMALSVGTGGSAIWINDGTATPRLSILGRPVIQTEKVPKLGDAGDVNFVDFGFYLIGDRQVMSARQSEHYAFKTDEIAYRIIQRLDGTPWVQSAMTPKNGGATVSPFVSLAART